MTDRDFTNAQNLTSPHFGNQFLLDVQQTIYSGGAINAGIRMSELRAKQAQLDLTLNEQNQRFIALGQYLDLEKIANREKVLKAISRLLRNLLRISKRSISKVWLSKTTSLVMNCKWRH